MRASARTYIAVLAVSLVVGLPAHGAGEFPLQHAGNDVSNIASLQRGARNFVNFCMGCHSAQYVRYNRLAEDLGLSEDQVIDNLMFAAEKPQETMTIAMPEQDAQGWFGQAPPDLSLIARSRGPDYLYTFLKTFYLEPGSPTGVNNLVLANASMPHVLWELQGEQRLIEETDDEGHRVQRLEMVRPGRLSPDEYDQFVRDIVNFLDYVGEPMQRERIRLGGWVIAFLLVFGLFSYLLKEEIWKDIK
ncbi:MAG: cytochrome c1 [Chromatiales bacterium]|nr:MAG: cytochrome c1 [Chromatiales bacterium]